MDSHEIKQNICRICLDESIVLDWNATLYGYCDITYKDCYYKYTQMDCPASDPFSSMLCQTCLNGLYNIHTLILKALKSHKFFQEVSNLSARRSSNLKDNEYTPEDFEIVLVEKIEAEPIIQDHFVYEHSNDELIKTPEEANVGKNSKQCRSATITMARPGNAKDKIDNSTKNERNCSLVSTLKTNDFDHNFPQYFEESFGKSQRKARRRATQQMVNQQDNTSKNVTVDREIAVDRIQKPAGVIDSEESNIKKRNKEAGTRRMCSICSKILQNNYAVQLHEKTHMKNRERKETCKVCGLKFYDKRNLYSHTRIHKENREKIHKCEFCNKSFFQKGALNVHRRIHLGQMVPCSLCTKQFYRQIDLERHMGTHSATTINSDTKTRSRYFVRCKHCGKSILSTSFKSHTAAHMNEPLMKCSICSKEFFRRESCVFHVKKIHNKTNGEYNDFIIRYKNDRMSHLFLEQKAEIQYTDDKLHAS